MLNRSNNFAVLMLPGHQENPDTDYQRKAGRKIAYPTVIDETAEERPHQQIIRHGAVRTATEEELQRRRQARIVENHYEEPDGIRPRLPDENRHQDAYHEICKAKELGRAIHALVHGKDCPKHRDDNKDALDNPEQFLFQRFEVIPELF